MRVVGILALAALACAAVYLAILTRPHVDPPTRTMADVARLRRIVQAALATPALPMRDGAFDPYELVQRGQVPRETFRSERSETGPTDEEIDRGDYTNFPWERYRGDPNGKGLATLPLLWEKAPVEWACGRAVIALADGSVRCCEHEEFLARVLAGLVVQTGRVPMRDGTFDPYQFARDGLIHRGFLRAAFERVPSDEEIAHGDYANFPWERYRGDGNLHGPPVALLRATLPDYDGDIIVGLSDGTVTWAKPAPPR